MHAASGASPLPVPPRHDPVYQAAVEVATRLQGSGFTAYFAGGFARDLLIGRGIHDIDIATNARPDAVQSLFPKSREIGKSFGVIQVTSRDYTFDVATFRRESGYTDGRHPGEVDFTTAADDAQRRDFTINGMFYDPFTEQIIDYVGGVPDIQRRRIACIGDPYARFVEDHLRLLRAIRFAAVLDFSIEDSTWRAIQHAAPHLAPISAERIREEIIRAMMEAPKPGNVLYLLRDAGLLPVILPEIQAMNGVEQPPDYHPEGDVFVHTALMLNMMTERSPRLIWSILMHDVAKPPTFAIIPDKSGQPKITFRGHADLGATMAGEIMRRFRCSNEEIDAVTIAVKNHMRFGDIPDMKESTLRRWVGAPTFPLELELHRIDCLASHNDLAHFEQIKQFRQKLSEKPVLPPPLIRGKDAMECGMSPSPAMGKLLREAYDRQLEGVFTDRESALIWLKQRLQP